MKARDQIYSNMEGQNYIKSTHLVRDIKKDFNFYQINIQGNINLKVQSTELTPDEFNFQINQIGMIFSEIYVHTAAKEKFTCIDDFVYFSRINEGCNKKNMEKYPFKKETALNKNDFVESYNLYFIEIFLDSKEDLLNIMFEKYIEGYFYFNNPSIVTLACMLENSYWCFTYLPYI